MAELSHFLDGDSSSSPCTHPHMQAPEAKASGAFLSEHLKRTRQVSILIYRLVIYRLVNYKLVKRVGESNEISGKKDRMWDPGADVPAK